VVGNNSFGQLGLNTVNAGYSSPVMISQSTYPAWIDVAYLRSGRGLAFVNQNNQPFFSGQASVVTLANTLTPVQVGALSTWTTLFTNGNKGGSWMAAIKNPGTLWTWGNNSWGQLGLSNQVNYSSPIQVGALSAWTQISGGLYYTVALQSPGSLWAWGNNSFGQLGTSNQTNYFSPVQVGQSVAATWNNAAVGPLGSTVAIQNNGTLWAWGRNETGQLGLSDTSNRSSPTQVGTSSTWTQVACGYRFTLAIQSPGTLWAWGSNGNGQLGQSNITNLSRPVQVGALSTWTQVSCGIFSSYAIQSNGSLWSWGFNSNGQLGVNTSTTNISSPVQVGALSTWTQISCGYSNALAIQSNGTLWAWGSGPALGLNTTTTYSSPVQVGALSIWTSISIGRNSVVNTDYALALQSNGTLWSWGNNSFGQLGTNTLTFSNMLSPVQIGATSNWTIIASQTNHVLAIQSGRLYSWGLNSWGQLGLNTLTNYSSPVQVGALSTWSRIATCGNNFSVGILNTGILYSWGINTFGQLGTSNQTNYSSPVQVGSTAWTQLAGSYFNTLAIQTNGTLWSWGYNFKGQLGLSDQTNRSSPVQVGALNYWTQVNCGYNFTGAILSPGTLWMWGDNSWGQLGQNNQTNLSSPAQVGALTIWRQISCGYFTVAAIQSNGTLWAWGNNSYGQLGTSNQTNYSSPVQVGALSIWSQVTSGSIHTTAIQSSGTLWAWGNNNSGQLGLSDLTNRSSPVQVGTASTWIQTGPSNINTGARQNNNTLWAWGSNSFGQLGLYNPGAYSLTNYPSQFDTGNYNKVTASNSQSYFRRTADNTIVQTSTWDIPTIDTTNSIAWTSYDTGQNHFVGVQTNGTAWAIGNNSYGQLVASPAYYSQIAAGRWFFMSIRDDGSLWAWGLNSWGQLGTSNQTNYSSPVQTGTLTNWSQVASGAFHSAAIQSNGTLWAWGLNSYGAVGNGATTAVSSPVQVGAATSWSRVSCGYWGTAAVQSNGTLWTWGYNGYGTLGNGASGAGASTPIQIGALSVWTQVACGSFHTAAIQSPGTLWAWGLNDQGQLGLNTTTGTFNSPVQVGALSTWTQLSCGYNFTTAIQSPGTLWSWGSLNLNSYGQLGLNTTVGTKSPVQVGALSYWTQVSAGNGKAIGAAQGGCMLAVLSNGTLWACGYGPAGQLGLNTTTSYSSLVQVGSLSIWTRATAGTSSSAGVQSNRLSFTWGSNSYGQLGVNTSIANQYSSPVQLATGFSTNLSTVSTLTQIGSGTNWSRAIAADYGSMLIDNSNNAWVFGKNNQYQLGLSDNTNRSSPVQITYATGIQNAAMDDYNVWMIDGSNNLWGGGVGNKVSANTTTNYTYPTQKFTGYSWNNVATNQDTTLLISSNTVLYGFGNNSQGQLGIGSSTGASTYRYSPIQIGSINTTTKVETKAGSSIILFK
jgi:alpha-tubulin suppressor-like RCC1 family protein